MIDSSFVLTSEVATVTCKTITNHIIIKVAVKLFYRPSHAGMKYLEFVLELNAMTKEVSLIKVAVELFCRNLFIQ